MIIYRTGYGEDSHAFAPRDPNGKTNIKLAGTVIASKRTLLANSDGDIVWHALCRAIQSLTGVEILGKIADDLVKKGQVDSSYFLKLALADLGKANSKIRNIQITQIAISIEAKEPKLATYFPAMRKNLKELIQAELKQELLPEQIGIAAMTGEGLTACGKGEGITVKALLTVQSEIAD